MPIRDLGDDYYEFDEKNYCLIGRRKKRVYQLGDKLTVQVARANLDKKQLDFAIVDENGEPMVTVNKNGDVQKGSKPKKNESSSAKSRKGGKSKKRK